LVLLWYSRIYACGASGCTRRVEFVPSKTGCSEPRDCASVDPGISGAGPLIREASLHAFEKVHHYWIRCRTCARQRVALAAFQAYERHQACPADYWHLD